jgi:hypothetical protein
MFLEFLESLVWSIASVVLVIISLLFLFFLSVAYERPEARKKREAEDRLREAEHEKMMVVWKSLDVRHRKLVEIARLIAHSKPHSDEERRLLDLAESMNLTYDEWKKFNEHISMEQSPCSEYLPDTRPHIHYRQLRALESDAV